MLDENLKVYLNHPQIAGALIWQFCDCRVTDGKWGERPRTMNNKGTVDGQGYFSLSGTSSLSWTAVPEPTSALAGLLITAGLLRRRRA